MEVCVDSVFSAICAEQGGARRLELCSALELGGLTPSAGLLKKVKREVKIPVFPIIRPRKGDFLYTEDEIEIMKYDIEIFKENGAGGIVLGALNRDGTIDVNTCKILISAARPLPVTFHRAFDVATDAMKCLDDIMQLGCERLLTSGQKPTAYDGRNTIKQLIQNASGKLIIVPGGGITEDNLEIILENTGAKEFHASARQDLASNMIFKSEEIKMGTESDEYVHKVCSKKRVHDMVTVGKKFGIN